MAKKTHKTPKKKTLQEKQSIVSIRYIILGVAILALLASGKIYSSLSKTHVLGASTGPVLLAEGTSETSSGSGDNHTSASSEPIQGSHEGSTPAPSNSEPAQQNPGKDITGSNNSGESSSQPRTSQNDSAFLNSEVSCVGPDGKTFTTGFQDCQKLNLQWGNTNFIFTPLTTNNNGENKQETSITNNEVQQIHADTQQSSQTNQQPKQEGKLQTKDHQQIDLTSQKTELQIQPDSNGQVHITAKQGDGQEIELENNALSTINDVLKNRNLEISTTSAEEIAIASKNVTAHTDLPINVDPTTNTLAVTTEDGSSKDVNVSPDQAVQGLLTSHILSNVLSEASTGATDSANTTLISLTSENNQPVFQVQGVNQKHLLGLFPVAFQKTVDVSAQTGQVINTQESPLNQILESLSL